MLFSRKENKTCAKIIFQEQKNNSRKIKNNYFGNCIHAHKKMENNYSGIYFANHPTGKKTNGVQRLWSSPNSLHSTGYIINNRVEWSVTVNFDELHSTSEME